MFGLGNAMALFERGVNFTIRGETKLVCVTISLWLVDQPEGNKICLLSPLACRHCVEDQAVSKLCIAHKLTHNAFLRTTLILINNAGSA